MSRRPILALALALAGSLLASSPAFAQDPGGDNGGDGNLQLVLLLTTTSGAATLLAAPFTTTTTMLSYQSGAKPDEEDSDDEGTPDGEETPDEEEAPEDDGGQLVYMELYLRHNGAALRQVMALGGGAALDDLAAVYGLDTPAERAALGRALRRHRRELGALLDPEALDGARAHRFFARVAALVDAHARPADHTAGDST